MYKPQCWITFIQWGGESSKVRRRISHGANKPEGERAMGQMSRGQIGKGAKKPDTL